jgi:hypothetical protein
MDLDLAIQNTLRRSPMDSAMHGVLSNFGGHYELKSYTENAGLADQLFGQSVGITAPVGDANLAKPTISAGKAPVMGPVNQTFISDATEYTVSYVPEGSNWELVAVTSAPSGWDKVVNFFKNGGNTTGNRVVVITKYGDKSAHRFLTALEESSLSDDVKNRTASIVVSALSPEVKAVVAQPAQVPENPDIAGTSPISAQSFNQSNVMEMDLAAEYKGVRKLRSDSFMGDTVVPTPLSNIGAGMLRNAEGFNQNPVGQHIAPPTKMAGAESFRKNSRSL